MAARRQFLLRRIVSRARHEGVARFGDLFTDPAEMRRFRAFATGGEETRSTEPITFHPRCLDGKPVLYRPGTRDKSSLIELVIHQCYLPPPGVSDPKVIVDLGTNVGYTVAHLAHLYPKARVIGVELDRNNFEIAQRNTRWCGDRVRLINAAIWSSDGYVRFGGPGEDAFRVEQSISASEGAGGEGTARSISMKTLMAEHQIDRIDYLKMDIEGGEVEIMLNGDRAWLDNVDSIRMELHHVGYQPFHEALTAKGFHCRRDPRHVHGLQAIRR